MKAFSIVWTTFNLWLWEKNFPNSNLSPDASEEESAVLAFSFCCIQCSLDFLNQKFKKKLLLVKALETTQAKVIAFVRRAEMIKTATLGLSVNCHTIFSQICSDINVNFIWSLWPWCKVSVWGETTKVKWQH